MYVADGVVRHSWAHYHAKENLTTVLLDSMVPNMQLPECGNALAGTCERSSVYLSKETDSAYVITCRTCKSINIWPKVNDEGSGRHAAFLKHQAARTAQERYESLRPAFSYAEQRSKR